MEGEQLHLFDLPGGPRRAPDADELAIARFFVSGYHPTTGVPTIQGHTCGLCGERQWGNRCRQARTWSTGRDEVVRPEWTACVLWRPRAARSGIAPVYLDGARLRSMADVAPDPAYL